MNDEVQRLYDLNAPKMDAYLRGRAVVRATDYIESVLDQKPGIFDVRDHMGAYIVDQFKDCDGGSLWLEFGVWKGTSINYFACNLPHLDFYGFDSFVGLPEDWTSGGRPKKVFDLEGNLPKVEPNVTLISGWFKDTIPDFVAANRPELENLVCLYIDSDLYSSAVTVLEGLRQYIKPGVFIVFDEYLGNIDWENGEFKAWDEFCCRYNISYRYRAFHAWMAFIEVTDGT